MTLLLCNASAAYMDIGYLDADKRIVSPSRLVVFNNIMMLLATQVRG